MNGKYLIINAGSSSLKFSLYDMPDSISVVNGIVERIGNDSSYTLKTDSGKVQNSVNVSNHKDAVNVMLKVLMQNGFISDISEIKGVGHRVLHGGEFYSDSVLIDDGVIENISSLTKFGPLHHPGELAGICGIMSVLPDVPQVAVFDTAFHQTMPDFNFRYPVPSSWYYDDGVRKYGFHGTSHKYITQVMKDYYVKDNINLIICHIGSGASLSCIKDGQCFDTSMGLTPLDGVVMGTRSGSIDPSIIEYICKEHNISVADVINLLNTKSGLLGISGFNDFRDVERSAICGNKDCKLAIKMFEDSIVDYIAKYYFKLNGKMDALVFTAGVGENSNSFRERIVNSISKPMGIYLNKELNDSIASFKENKSGVISSIGSKHDVLVVPTDEEYMILKDTYDIIRNMNKSYVIKK